MSPALQFQPPLPMARSEPDWAPPVPHSALYGRCLNLLNPQPGQRVLDVGCGRASCAELAEQVTPGGQVIAVDYDVAVIERARELALEARVADRVSHHHANVAALPWQTGHFDGGLCEQVLQHLHGPEAGFCEFTRVIRPGGRLVVMDDDWTTLTIDGDEPDIERRLVQFHNEQSLASPYFPRRLHKLALETGLLDVEIELHPTFITDPSLTGQAFQLDRLALQALRSGVIDFNEYTNWLSGMRRAAAAGSFYASWNTVILAANRPEGGFMEPPPSLF